MWIRLVVVAVGLALVAVWLPLLVAGVVTLRSRGPFGDSDVLIVTGPYAHVRHPLYAGLSMTIVGIGLILGSWWVVMGGTLWLLVTWLWSIHEEKGLVEGFGSQYAEYRKVTPGFVPSLARFPYTHGGTT